MGAILIDPQDLLAQLLVRPGLVDLRPAALQLAGHLGIDKDAQGVAVPQNIVRAAADDDAVRLFRHLLQYLALAAENALVLLHQRIIHHHKATARMNGERGHRAVLDDLLHILFRERCAAGNLPDNLLVIIRVTQLLCQAAPKFPAAAAEFPANGDDFVHNVSILSA